jgi:hypothetical protein
MTLIVQKRVRRNGAYVWVRVSRQTFGASGTAWRRALPKLRAGRYRVQAQILASPTVKASVSRRIYFNLR